MFTIIAIILLFIENNKGTLIKQDFIYALMFLGVDFIDFTIAYFLFT